MINLDALTKRQTCFICSVSLYFYRNKLIKSRKTKMYNLSAHQRCNGGFIEATDTKGENNRKIKKIKLTQVAKETSFF